jgi:hypothetical protein
MQTIQGGSLEAGWQEASLRRMPRRHLINEQWKRVVRPRCLHETDVQLHGSRMWSPTSAHERQSCRSHWTMG